MDGKNDSRKRRTGTQEDGKSAEDNLESPSGARPKRRCTLNPKKVYSESEIQVAIEESKARATQKPTTPQKKGTPTTPQKKGTPTRPPASGVVIIDPHSNKLIEKPDIDEMRAKYKWMDHDSDTGKIRCKLCNAANLTKWFIVANETMVNLEGSLKLHEGSEEHRRSSKGLVASPPPKVSTPSVGKRYTPPAGPRQISRISDERIIRDVYCIPMECVDPIPLPGNQLRALLARHGLKGTVKFDQDLSPARLREDISRAFSKTFNLRSQELLQFDYLILSDDKSELSRPAKMLHFDAKTVLSFVGDNEVYILLKQKGPTQNVDWKKLLFQEKQLRNLDDAEYKEVMLSVMHRLSSGKHKKDSSQEQKALVESLISDYKLNNYHQLVYVGNSIDQLVLFTEKRRSEAFQTCHAGHPDLQTTFRKIFNLYYWNGIEQWVTARVRKCPECEAKYGQHALTSAKVTLDKIEDEIMKKVSPSNQLTNATLPLAPRPTQQPMVVQRIEPILKRTAKSPPSTSSKTGGYQVASIIPPLSLTKSGQQSGVSPLPLDIVKKEPAETVTNKQDLLPPEDDVDTEEADRDETLYEEDLEEAIQQNSKGRSDGSHCVNAMWAMYLLQQRGMFCDFFIMLLPSVYNNLKKPKIYGVHRIVFAAISSRIRQITKTTIKIGGKVTCEGLENVIEYGYTGRLTGIQEMQMGTITQVSNTAMALDIKIDHYLQKQRPDFTKTSAKILVTSNPGDQSGSRAEVSKRRSKEQGSFVCS